MNNLTTFAVLVRLIWLSLTFAVTGCVTTTGYRVDLFMAHGNSYVGKTISQAERGFNSIHLGIKTLSNGNSEKEYIHFWMRDKCHFFYEYEPKSGLIVKFRIEEKEKNACQAPGV